MEKQHINKVESLNTKNGYWTGFLVASKGRPSPIEGYWYLGFKVTVASMKELEKAINKFSYCKCSDPLGNRVSLYAK